MRTNLELEGTTVGACAPEAVMERLLDPSTWPEWQREILRTEGRRPLSRGDVVRGDASLLGFEVDGHSTTVAVEHDAVEEDVIVGVRMRIRYTVAAIPEGTLVSHRLTSKLPGGFAGTLLSLFLARRLRRMQREVLRELIRHSEAGSPSG